jgi:hypothetical protein
VRRWARIATAGVAVLAGATLVLAAVTIEALGEEGDPGAPGVVLGLGIATIVVGAATLLFPWARYVALALLGTAFWLAYSGELADDSVYEAVAGVSFVLLGLLSLIGARGRRAGPRASSGGGASPGAPSEGPSTAGGEPDGRAPRS